YAQIAEANAGTLERMLTDIEAKTNAMLNDDVQMVPVGTSGLAAAAVVVAPGSAFTFTSGQSNGITIGPLGDTDPAGDDVCAGPTVGGRCAGPIRAGANGIAETEANNRQIHLDLTSIVTSAYRNPQRNHAVGSVVLD